MRGGIGVAHSLKNGLDLRLGDCGKEIRQIDVPNIQSTYVAARSFGTVKPPPKSDGGAVRFQLGQNTVKNVPLDCLEKNPRWGDPPTATVLFLDFECMIVAVGSHHHVRHQLRRYS